ncbi:MAG TPA: hypothetical protein VFG90_10230, partial [Nitrososphaeraceae archaeon]|nr:hypothetical protein [Nitrososphaeraceae archaeon]
ILFGIFVISSIMLNPVLAQIPTMTGVGVKINTPSDSVSVPVGDLTIYGASSDNNVTNCQVYADWNDLKPMQIVTANGPKGDADYSKWSYTYNGDYHGIVEGSNELTSKITCYDQVQKLATSKSYSINVTGAKSGSEIVNNTDNESTVSDSEDTEILPVKSSSSNSESSNDTVEKSNESTDSEDTNVIPVKNILPLYSESNEESIKSASTEDGDETEVASTDTVELQDEPNSNETEVASTDTVELQDGPTSKEIIDSDSETYATVSSKQQGETGESNTIDMSESEATEVSDEGLTSHSESNTFFTFEPDLVADEFSNNDENTVGTSSSTDSSVSNHDSDDNSIFGLKFNGLEDATKNKIEKKIEKLEDRIADRVQLFDLIG